MPAYELVAVLVVKRKCYIMFPCRSKEMEGRSESDRGEDEVYLATFGDKEKNELKLD